MSFLSKLRDQAEIQARKLGQQSNAALQGFTLEKECDRAARTLKVFLANPSNPKSALNSIPKAVLRRARGLVVLTVIKAGMVWSAKGGSGIIICRLPDGQWSPPSCVATGGLSVGFQMGAEISEFVIVLNTRQACDAFVKDATLTIGGSLSATAGPVGAGGSIDTALSNPAAIFTYSKSKGLYAGVALAGTVLIERKEANRAFYGQQIPARDILSGQIPQPEIASALYQVIEAAEDFDESSLRSKGHVDDEELLHSPTNIQTFTKDQQPLFDASYDT